MMGPLVPAGRGVPAPVRCRGRHRLRHDRDRRAVRVRRLSSSRTDRAAASCASGWAGYEVQIVDEHDEPLGPDEVGELVVRTTRAVGDQPRLLRHAGGHRRGVAQRVVPHRRRVHAYDADGNYYFVDRIKDAIRRRGENISSFEVEALVEPAPRRRRVGGGRGAVGVPRGRGEGLRRARATVRSCHPRRAHRRSSIPRMPKFMVPRYVEFVDALPKTEATMRTQKVEAPRAPRSTSEPGIARPPASWSSSRNGGRGSDVTTYETILVDVDGGVTTITLNRPDQRNAINLDDGAGAVRRRSGALEHDDVGARDRRHRRREGVLLAAIDMTEGRLRGRLPGRARPRARRHVGHGVGVGGVLAHDDARARCDQRRTRSALG